jgi:hypothetical protein
MVSAGLNFDSVVSNIGFNCGRHYWEYHMKTILDEKSIYIGVTSVPGPL